MAERIVVADTFRRISELTHRIEKQRQVVYIDGGFKFTYTFSSPTLPASFRDLEGKKRVVMGAEIAISDVTDGLRPNDLVRASYRQSGYLYEVDLFNPVGGVRLAMPEDGSPNITIMCMDSKFTRSNFLAVMRFGEQATSEEFMPYGYEISKQNERCVVTRIDNTGGPKWTVIIPMSFDLNTVARKA